MWLHVTNRCNYVIGMQYTEPSLPSSLAKSSIYYYTTYLGDLVYYFVIRFCFIRTSGENYLMRRNLNNISPSMLVKPNKPCVRLFLRSSSNDENFY